MYSTTLKQIAISKRNYEALKKLGGAGDSFNDVISKLLKTAITPTQKEIEKEEKVTCASSTVTSLEEERKKATAVQPPMTQERSET